MRAAAHARGDDRVTRRKRGLGEKRRVDNINSFEYSHIVLQRTRGPDRMRPTAVANYRRTFGVRFRGEFVTVTLAGLIGIGSRVLFDLRRGDASLRLFTFDATREPGSVSDIMRV